VLIKRALSSPVALTFFSVSALARRCVLRVPLSRRNSAALDRLSEEQGQEGGALAHADQRAAGIRPAGMRRSSPAGTGEAAWRETFHRMR